MAGQTGSRGTLFEKIDALSDCTTLAELTPKIQAILSNMAYFVINSDGAINDTHEEWHEDFASRLRTGVSQGKAAKSSASRAVDIAPAEKKKPRPVKPKAESSARPKFEKPLDAVPEARASKVDDLDDVPDSLRAIMLGTHPSLKGDDDEDDGNMYARSAGRRPKKGR